MYINLTLSVDKKEYDIRIDSQQHIGAGLEILRECGKVNAGELPSYYHSKLNEKLVSAFQTFEEETIFDGDLLTDVLWKQEEMVCEWRGNKLKCWSEKFVAVNLADREF